MPPDPAKHKTLLTKIHDELTLAFHHAVDAGAVSKAQHPNTKITDAINKALEEVKKDPG